jgi:hypothetical protein
MISFLFLLVGVVFLLQIIDWSAFTRWLNLLVLTLDRLIVALFVLLLVYSFCKTCMLIIKICDHLAAVVEGNHTSHL